MNLSFDHSTAKCFSCFIFFKVSTFLLHHCQEKRGLTKHLDSIYEMLKFSAKVMFKTEVFVYKNAKCLCLYSKLIKMLK